MPEKRQITICLFFFRCLSYPTPIFLSVETIATVPFFFLFLNVYILMIVHVLYIIQDRFICYMQLLLIFFNLMKEGSIANIISTLIRSILFLLWFAYTIYFACILIN